MIPEVLFIFGFVGLIIFLEYLIGYAYRPSKFSPKIYTRKDNPKQFKYTLLFQFLFWFGFLLYFIYESII